MRRRLVHLAAVLGVTIASLAATTAPASAETTAGNFDFPDGVLYDGCFDYEYEFFLDLPEGTTDWSLEVSIQKPDGEEIGSDYTYGTGRIGTLSSEVFLCGAEDAGSLTAFGVVEGYDYDYNTFELDMEPQTFTMRRPYSQTTARLLNVPKCGKVIKMEISTQDERPNGYFPADEYAQVAIQQYFNDEWIDIRGTQVYVADDNTGTGISRIRWTPNRNGKCKPIILRGTTVQDVDSREASYSPSILIK